MIGIFDSGTGGLSVYREIVKLLPQQRYVYFSDNAHCPYGEKTREYILDRARAITDFLIGEGCEVVVVACNTATAASIADLRQEYGIPFIGMEPAVKPAALSTQTGVIGVLATAGTLKASKYLDTRDKYSDGVQVVERVGQGFVELVEKGMLTGPIAEQVVERSLAPLLSAGADRIVLGCTHYPFLLDTLKTVAARLMPSRDVLFIDPAPAAARQTLRVLQARGISEADPSGPGISLRSSGDPTSLERIFSLIQ